MTSQKTVTVILEELCQLAHIRDTKQIITANTALTFPYLVLEVQQLYEEAKHDLTTHKITPKKLNDSLECLSAHVGYAQRLLITADTESQRHSIAHEYAMAIASSKSKLVIAAAYRLRDNTATLAMRKALENIPTSIYPKAVPILEECLQRTPAIATLIATLVEQHGKNGKYLSQLYFLSHLLPTRLPTEVQWAVYEKVSHLTTEGRSLETLTGAVNGLIHKYDDQPDKFVAELKKHK